MNKNKIKGFTLIEMMIVVAILGIVSAIAIPSYNEYVRKAKRTDGKEFLIRVAQLQESYYVQNLSYAKDFSTNPGGLGLGAIVESEQGEYSITMDTTDSGGGACTGLSADSCTTYTLNAAPQGGQINDKCKELTLTNTGVKGLAGLSSEATAQQIKDCW